MKKALILLLSLAVLPLHGCAQRIELAFMAVCLGVDARAAGYTLTVKCPDYGGDDQQGGYAVLSADGPDWLQGGWRQRFTSLKIDVTVDARPRQQPLLQHRLTFHGRYGIIQSRKRKSSTGTCPVCFLRVLGNTRGCGLHPRRFHLAKERNGPPLLRLCGAHAGAVSQGCRLCPGSFTGVGGASLPSAP